MKASRVICKIHSAKLKEKERVFERKGEKRNKKREREKEREKRTGVQR